MKYVYIIGSGHSGSTLFDLMLSNSAEIFSMGEMAKLHRTVKENGLCSCMYKINECHFWKSIIHSYTENDIKTISYGDVKYKRERFLNKKDFIKTYPQLLKKIVEKTGVPTVCDSSKKLERLKGLLKISEIELYVLFLTRHPGGVTSSHKRKGRSFYYYLISWLKNNYDISNFLKKANLQYKSLKYENLVEDPIKETKDVFDFIGINYDINKINKFNKLRHMIAGNRIRLEHQNLKIHSPSDWRNSLTTKQVFFAELINKYSDSFLPC